MTQLAATVQLWQKSASRSSARTVVMDPFSLDAGLTFAPGLMTAVIVLAKHIHYIRNERDPAFLKLAECAAELAELVEIFCFGCAARVACVSGLLSHAILPAASHAAPNSPRLATTRARLCYRGTGNVWQTLNIGKSPRAPNNLSMSGAVHGQVSERVEEWFAKHYRCYDTSNT